MPPKAFSHEMGPCAPDHRATVETALRQHSPETESVSFLETVKALGRTTTFEGTVEFEGATSDYILEQPNRPISELCLLLTPGYMGVMKAYDRVREAAAAAGIATVSFDPARTQKGVYRFDPNRLIHPEMLLAKNVEAIMLRMKYGHGFERFILSGHSMGGPAVTTAALWYPDMVESLVLSGSGGLSGDNPLTLAAHGPDILAHEIWPNRKELRKISPFMLQRLLRYVFTDIVQTSAEGIAIASADIVNDVVSVGQAGVNTTVQAFPGDRFFHETDMRERCSEAVTLYSRFPDDEALHVSPQLNPTPVANHQLDLAFGLAKAG